MTRIAGARVAVLTIFFVNGTILGTWAAQIPLIKERLGMSEGVLGLTLLMIAAGSLVSMPSTGVLISKIGSGPIARASAIAMTLSIPLAILAPSVLWLAAALFVIGAANGAMDVSMNAHGAVVEDRLGKAVMSSFHGMFSLGGLVGAGAAIPLLAVLDPISHVFLIATVLFVASVLVFRLFLPGDEDRGETDSHFALPTRATLFIGGLAFIAFLAEGAMLDWSGVYLADTMNAPAVVAASGFAAFSATMAIGRFAGDFIRSHIGATLLLAVGGLLIAIGIGLALAATTLPITLIGFAIAGLGASNLVPILFVAASRIDPKKAGENIAAIATIAYLGILAGPPVIGFVAEATSLTFGLALVAALALLITAGARTAGR